MNLDYGFGTMTATTFPEKPVDSMHERQKNVMKGQNMFACSIVQ